jgi:hypothetical protein
MVRRIQNKKGKGGVKMISDNDAMMNWENRIFNQAKENERTANIGRTLRELEAIGLDREKSLSIISTSFDLSKEDITQELERFEEITRLIKGLSQLFSEDDLTDIIKNSYGFQLNDVKNYYSDLTRNQQLSNTEQ